MTPIHERYQETMNRKAKEQHRANGTRSERQRGRLAMLTAVSVLLGAAAIIYAVTS